MYFVGWSLNLGSSQHSVNASLVVSLLALDPVSVGLKCYNNSYKCSLTLLKLFSDNHSYTSLKDVMNDLSFRFFIQYINMFMCSICESLFCS